MGCMEKSFCPADAVGAAKKHCTPGGDGDDFMSKCLTCSYFQESWLDLDRPAYHCGPIGMCDLSLYLVW